VLVGPTTTSCTAGSPFASQLVDILDCTTIGNASIAAIGSDGVPFSGAAATTASDGAYAVCAPVGSPFSVQIKAALYPTTYYAEMLNNDGGYLPQMGTMSSASLAVFSAIVPDGFDPSRALIVIKIVGESCHGQEDGWSVVPMLPDGGPLPDGGYEIIYLGSSELPDPTATATAKSGVALVYNVDPSISDFLMLAASNPDAGSCEAIAGAEGFTGRLFVAGGATTIDFITLP
jgi:hypothetical protein